MEGLIWNTDERGLRIGTAYPPVWSRGFGLIQYSYMGKMTQPTTGVAFVRGV